MKRIEIEISEHIKGKLIKDLRDNEEICESCKGTGLVITDNAYGLKGEPGFPYKKQTLVSCRDCFGGVRSNCKYCGKLIKLGYVDKCDCEGYEAKEREEEKKAKENLFNRANKMTYEEYLEKYTDYLIYSDVTEDYYYDLDEFEDMCEMEDIDLPEYVYGTHRVSIDLNIDDILESACDDLHEEAYYNLVGVEELYQAMEKFNQANEIKSATYFPNYLVMIKIDRR